MTEAQSNADNIQHRPTLKDWLLTPFTYIADWQALALGLGLILLAGVIGYFGNTHFDGVLDMHTGLSAPLQVFLLEGIIDWLSLAIVLYIIGKLLSRAGFRMIDLFGTQALARWPTVLMAAIALAPPYQRFSNFLLLNLPQMMQGQRGIQFPVFDGIVFLLLISVILTLYVLMVALMYRSYSLCCNVRGAKAALSFIAGLLIAEIISKLALSQIFSSWLLPRG